MEEKSGKKGGKMVRGYRGIGRERRMEEGI